MTPKSRQRLTQNPPAHFGFERASLAIELARAIAIVPSFITPSRRGESTAVGHYLLAAGAYIEVGFRILGEVAAREGPVLALGLVEHLHVRFDPALIHQASEHLG